MNVNELYNSGEYLKAADLDEQRHTVTIERVEYRDLQEKDGSFRKKAVLFFAGRKKSLVCNTVNANAISDGWFLPEADQWVGGVLELRVDQAFWGGKNVPAIRVSCVSPPPPVVAQPAEENSF